MKGHKRFRSGAWRLAVFAGVDPDTGRKRYLFETVRTPNNRMGAKAADARLAQLIAAVEEGRSDPAFDCASGYPLMRPCPGVGGQVPACRRRREPGDGDAGPWQDAARPIRRRWAVDLEDLDASQVQPCTVARADEA